MYHAANLKPHQPNNDCLFSGRLDTQLSSGDGTEGKWAVELIVTHAGSKEDAIFQLKWRVGDCTWLPYNQVSHLQALIDYFDLIGVKKIAELPSGTGTPPSDPQTYIGPAS